MARYVLDECLECGARFARKKKRLEVVSCAHCRFLESKYPDGVPPEVEGALIVARAIRSALAGRKAAIGVGEDALDRIADHLWRIEDRLREISDEAQG